MSRALRLHDELVADSHPVSDDVVPRSNLVGRRIEARGDAEQGVAPLDRVIDRRIDQRRDIGAQLSLSTRRFPLRSELPAHVGDETVERSLLSAGCGNCR